MDTEAWWWPILKHGTWAVAMAAIMGWLARSRLQARTLSDSRHLHCPTSFLIIALVSLGFFSACAILSNLYPNDTTTWWTTAVFVGFAALSVILVLECVIISHAVSEAGLVYRRWPGTRHSLEWRDLRSVRYAPVFKWFRLETRTGEVARISAMLIGLPEFAHLLLAHAPSNAIEEKTRAILVATANGHPPSIWT